MILVTGGTGLVGSHLLYQLTKKGNTVRAIYRSEHKINEVKKVFSFYRDDFLPLFNKIEWIKADITDISSLEIAFSIDITTVYHCAALVSFKSKDYFKMRKTNIEGTANIVNFCIDHKIKKLCHVSSIATLGDSIKKQPITEENERNESNNNGCYAITKYGAEMEVWRASQEGVDVVIVNPGVILGYGFFNEGSGKMFSQVQKGLKFYTEGVTGFVGVKDVVKIMVALMDSEIKNERFVLVSENKSFKEMFFLIADFLNKKRPTIKVGKLLMAIVWRLDWLLSKIIQKEPILTKSSAKSSQNKDNYSAQKMKNSLSYIFEPIEVVVKNICAKF